MRSLMLTASPLYAGLLALLFLALTVRVMLKRRELGHMFGSGGDPDFERIIRAHGNFVEYAPLGILLLLIIELIGAPNLLVHLLGLTLLIGRLAHAAGVAGRAQIVPLRAIGIVLTLLSLLGLTIAVLVYWFRLAMIAA